MSAFENLQKIQILQIKPEENQMNIVDKIKKILKEKHWTQKALSKQIGVSPTRLNNWLHNRSYPNAEWITDKIDNLFAECGYKE